MKLQDRLEDGLNELRIVLLGGQVFAAFAYNSCFQSRFGMLPPQALRAQAAAITIITAAFAWLLWPAAFHQIAEGGRLTRRIQRLTTRALDWGLLPLAIAVSLCALPVAVIMGSSHVWLPVAAAASVTIAAWYAGILVRKPKHHPPDVEAEDKLEQRIKFVLTECRVVLPGAQATLGFLFADVFVESFANLPRSSQITHITALMLVLIATIILMAPAAYHRLATRGEPSESVHTVASRSLLAAMVFLAPGMGAELFVVLRKLTNEFTLSVTVATAFVLLSYTLWFAFSLFARQRQQEIRC